MEESEIEQKFQTGKVAWEDKKESAAAVATDNKIVLLGSCGRGDASTKAVNLLLANGFVLADVQFIEGLCAFSYSLRNLAAGLESELNVSGS